MSCRFVVPGMPTPVGWGRDVSCVPNVVGTLGDNRTFCWDAIRLSSVFISHPVHLTLIEGASPFWIFMAAQIEEFARQRILPTTGPFILLSAHFPDLHVVPYVAREVVLGRPREYVQGARLLELLRAMVNSLTSSRNTPISKSA